MSNLDWYDFVEEEKEVREKIREVTETVDKDGNLVHGPLPQVVGDQVIWPEYPTQQQLEAPLSVEITNWVEEHGEPFLQGGRGGSRGRDHHPAGPVDGDQEPEGADCQEEEEHTQEGGEHQ